MILLPDQDESDVYPKIPPNFGETQTVPPKPTCKLIELNLDNLWLGFSLHNCYQAWKHLVAALEITKANQLTLRSIDSPVGSKFLLVV